MRAPLHSVIAAKAAQLRERADVTRKTNITFDGDRMVLPQDPPRLRLVPKRRPPVQCGLCDYKSYAVRHGQAVRSVAAHIVYAHIKPKDAA